MNKILSLLLLLSVSLGVWAQGGSGVGYDPVNPPDPQAGYRLKLEASPSKGGYLSPSDLHLYQAGESVRCEANARVGYVFREWREGDQVVSTSPSFYYEMPHEHVTLTAWFDKVEYDPENPGDPYLDGYTHWVRVYTTPSIGGYSNNSSFLMKEGDETWIYAYPNSNFKFSCWKQNGEIISTSRELKVTMGKKNLEYTAQYVYNPSDPGDPLPNLWNETTGELIIDHFEPGNLWWTIENLVGYDNCSKVTSLIVIGKMDNYDLGCVRNMQNLTDADFSRTSGCTYVPSYIFQDCQALTKVSLPASVQDIQYGAFAGCSNLSEMDVYASMPPTIDSDYTFSGVPENMVVKVYSSSIDLYETAPYWKNYKIMTLDEDNTALTVYLPDDAADGRYRNASIQLNNLSTGQSQRLIVTGTRTQYVFGNLIPEMKYSLFVLAPNGTEIGSELDFEIQKKGKEIRLASLKQMREIKLALLNPEGSDVAGQASISWFDGQHSLLGHGVTLSGQLEGDEVGYEVSLPRDLGISFRNVDAGTWIVTGDANEIRINLQPHATGSISGKLTDAQSGQPIAGGYVTVAQKLNGQYDVANTTSTGTDGSYNLEIYDDAGTLTAGSMDHIETMIPFNSRNEAAKIADVSLKPLSGTEITLTLQSRENVEKGGAQNDFSDYSDYAKVNYSVRNATKGHDVDWRLRFPLLVVLDPTDEGDVIEITATPDNKGLNAASAKATVRGGKGNATLKFISNGDIHLKYTGSEADEVVALLYDGDGNLVKKSVYSDKEAAFNGIVAGKYSVVTMASSPIFSGAGTLVELSSSKLSMGTDYILSETEVNDGFITVVKLDDIPVFDESLFLYTGNETSVTVNKTSMTVGSIVTVRSKVDFLPEYSSRIGYIKMVFSIPEGCEYVDNSLIVPGNGAYNTVISEGKISIEVHPTDASPRFCIIPRKGGEFRPSAMIEFNLDGETIRQPIGSALFTAGDFTLSVPPRTSVKHITARGGTTPLSEVKVYDNDVLVGTTHSLTNGNWRLGFDLYNPVDLSEHVIRAEIITPEGVRYRTEASTTVYDKEWAELTDIKMIYGGSTIDFNQIDATTSPASYSYVPGNDMFTFKTSFRDGHAEKVKDLYFVILLSDGSYRRMEGVYLPSSSTWTCAIGFPDINRLPVNVKVFYSEKRDEEPTLPEWKPEVGTTFRCPDVIPVIDPSGYVYEGVPSNRLSGVEATIFYKEFTEDMYGDVHEKMTKWDAEAYAQENPLFTDSEGMYQWDVPQGEWMVRFEKKGYETSSTDWLPVPPPQLDVNVGMKQMVRPQVKEAHAYEQTVDIEFDKYMDPSHLNTYTIVVIENGEKVNGTVTMINPEEADGNTYASAVRFEASQPFAASKVSLMVSNKVTSYAGIQMEESFQQEFTVEPSITAINIAEETECYIGIDGKISVEVLPIEGAAGKTLKVQAGSAIVTIDDNVVLDKEGKAEVHFKGELPGVVDIAVSVEGSHLPAAVTHLNLSLSPIFAENINLNRGTEIMKLGDTLILNATVLPENTTDKSVIWSSSDESVAVVDENGEVTVVGVGKATIKASCGGVSSECILKCYPQTGDANWNGEITITDAVDITNYVVKKKTAPKDWDEDEWTEFYIAGANANESEDGIITFADASATVRLALTQPAAVSTPNRIRTAYSGYNESSDALVIASLSETNDGKTTVAVKLDNSKEYVALQADIFISDGRVIELKPGNRSANHSLETMRFDDNHIRVALFNLGNKAFDDSNDPIFEITTDTNMSDSDGLTISNILAADSDANEYRLSSRTETVTGVESVAKDAILIVKVSDGVQVSNAIGKRIDICTMDGQIMRSFVAKDSLETINLSSGIYVIKAGDKILKVVL